MANCINGFNSEEIFQLYAFVEAYEVAGIKSYQTQTRLFKEHPELKELAIVLEKVKCHYLTCKNCEEIKSYDIKGMNEEIYFTEYQTGQLLSLLYHLRNSIAHACSVKYGAKVLITDYKVSRPVDFSARGCLSLETINVFTHILKKVIL